MKKLIIASSLLIVLFPYNVKAQLFVEENFNSSNYPVGSDLSGANPNVTGFTGSWVFDSSSSSVHTDGVGSGIINAGPLSYGGIQSSGNKVVSSSGSWIVSRGLDTTSAFSSVANTNGTIGLPGSTVYMSFLYNVSVQPFALNLSVRLQNGPFGAGQSTTGVGGIYLGYSPGINQNDFTFELQDNNGEFLNGTYGDLGAIQNGATNLFVIETQFGLNGTDTVSIFRNTFNSNQPIFSETTQGLNYNSLTLARSGVGSGSMSISDIKFGTTFGSVVPEPSTWTLLLGGCGLLVILYRRRRSSL
jgi:hypothetical protein